MPSTTPSPHDLSPRFTATGSEYFGIWIVNLMLMIVTLGIYYPWARARSLKFFAGNTDIGGYRLEFTGQAGQMVGGFMLAMIAYVLYLGVDQIDARLGWLVFSVGLLAWPWLMRAALRFRLSRTRWRGLPMRFTGTIGQAYAPLLAPLVIVSLLALLFWQNRAPAWTAQRDQVSPFDALTAVDYLQGLLALLLIALLPYLHYRYTRFKHQHFAWGATRSRFRARVRSYYGLYLRTGLLALAILAIAMVALGAAQWLGGAWPRWLVDADGGRSQAGGMALLLTIAIMLIATMAVQLLGAYFSYAGFNLRWSATDAPGLQVTARLSFWRWYLLRLKNLLLLLLTLGLYKPYAQVSIVGMQLAALSITSEIDIAGLVAQAERAQGSAASDAAANLFDLDLGL